MIHSVGRRYVRDLRSASIWWLPVALAFGEVPPVVGEDAPRYTARLITPGISALNAAAMNEAGDVVGTGTTGSGAWVSFAGAPAVLLPLPPGAQFGFANDINDAGVIVGSVGPSSYPGLFGKAVAWIPDGFGEYTIQQFGTLPGHVSSDATAVNNVGDIVGYSSNGTFRYAVLFTGASGIQDLSSTGVFDPSDVNDQRVLVDHSYYTKRLDLDTMIVENLGAPGPGYASSWGEAINESGQVAGNVINTWGGSNCPSHAARYTNGVGWEVLSGCGQANGAWDINDLGDVVMRLNLAPYVTLQGVGTFRIEDLVIADVGHWYVINGYGLTINNSRQMAVPATNSVTNESGIILLTLVVPGDTDGDGDVDLSDLGVVLAAYGTCGGDPGFAAAADLDQSGCVDLSDLGIVLANYGT